MSEFTAGTTLDTAALAKTALGAWISLHVDTVGTDGSNEATGGSPAYAREETTWDLGATSGEVVGTEVVFDVPAGTYTHFGIWTASTGGVYIDGGEIAETTLASQGTINLTPTVTET